jgi:hypothetical protein
MMFFRFRYYSDSVGASRQGCNPLLDTRTINSNTGDRQVAPTKRIYELLAREEVRSQKSEVRNAYARL